MVHRLVVGRTGMGKSRVMRERIIPGWLRHPRTPRQVAVLDPLGQDWGRGCWVTTDPYEWLDVLKRSRYVVGVVDEPELAINADPKLMQAMLWAATISRNYGHLIYFLAQSGYQLPVRFRSQCTWGYVFQQFPHDCRALVETFGNHELMTLPTQLPPGTCLLVKPLAQPVLVKVFDPPASQAIAGRALPRPSVN